MRAFYIVTLSIIGFALTGCAVSKVPKGDLYPEMYGEMPKVILVVPAINHSTAADAPNLYSSTVAQPLANAGFYVLSTEITRKFFENEGLTTGEQLTAVPYQKFREVFGADAVLYVTIEKWDTNYFVLGGNVTVGISYAMKSTKTGATLWSYANQMVVDTSGDSNNSGLLGALIATAIKTSTQSYVPIAAQINFMALSGIPFGEYHELHGKDKTIMVIAPKKK